MKLPLGLMNLKLSNLESTINDEAIHQTAISVSPDHHCEGFSSGSVTNPVSRNNTNHLLEHKNKADKLETGNINTKTSLYLN